MRLPNWVGDVCMSLPSLDALINTGIPIVVCARKWAKDLLSAYNLAEFIPMDNSWLNNAKNIRTIRNQYQAKHNLGLLLPDSLSSALSFKFAGVTSCGYKDDGRSLLLRWPINKLKPKPHAVESWYELTYLALEYWQFKLPDLAPSDKLNWQANDKHEQLALAAIKSAGLNSKQFVLIAPTAVGLHHGQIKVWQHFEQLSQSLIAQGYNVVMAPPPAEQAIAKKTVPSAKLLPALSLGAFASLTKHASLVICNDSGVSHLAAANNADQITLFGVTDPHHTGPWSPKAINLGTLGSWPKLSEVLTQTLDFLQQEHESK